MSDGQIYGRIWEDPAFASVGFGALGIWATTISWCCEQYSDGRLPAAAAAEMEMPSDLIGRLVCAGLFVPSPSGDGWVVSGFLGDPPGPHSNPEPGFALPALSREEYACFDVLPFQDFDVAHQIAIESAIAFTKPPVPRWKSRHQPLSETECSLPSRAFAEWHMRRGKHPLQVRQVFENTPFRKRVIRTYGRVCWLCDREIVSDAELTLDHVIPKSRRGPTTVKNLRPAHRVCNLRRGDRPAEEFRMRLNFWRAYDARRLSS